MLFSISADACIPEYTGREIKKAFSEVGVPIKGSATPRSFHWTVLQICSADPESRALIKALRDQDQLRREQNRLAIVQAGHDDHLHRIETRQAAFEDGVSYFTVLGYANYIKAHIDLAIASRIGMRASGLSRQRAIPIDKSVTPGSGR